MCGIIAVLRRRARRAVPSPAAWTPHLERARSAIPASLGSPRDLERGLGEAAAALEAVNAALLGPQGVACLLGAPDAASLLASTCAGLETRVAALEAELDRPHATLSPAGLERAQSALVRVKDAVWALHRDRLRTARAVGELAGSARTAAALEAYTSIQVALSALDRLEVRGRDSAGLGILVSNHGLDLAAPEVQAQLAQRTADALLRNRAVRVAEGRLHFVYKHAAEIGELGDNTAALRRAIREDPLLRLAVSSDGAEALVLGHTRWASVGIISQPNAHPVDSDELEPTPGPYVLAALNGDVDNYAELRDRAGLRLHPEITTDTKVIPTLVSRAIAAGRTPLDAFRETVAGFHGSVAIGAATAAQPGQLLLALRGSGQALYVGMAEDAFVVASEPYGVVEETATYLRMDGETPGNPANPAGSQGQILRLDRAGAGTPAGITRLAYDGTPLPVAEREWKRAQITTRDIDRGAWPHFLLKEVHEAPASFRKTLRGRIREERGRLSVLLGEESLPASLVARLQRGEVRHLLVIGQGTAAVAGRGIAMGLQEVLGERIAVRALPATELSGFHLRDDMHDTLVIAVSQSGTTTDTNRTVDLARARGATVLAIVNRRNSDLTDKADGVLYTSDGRDVEMSVASTKAFYAQIAAGTLLTLALAQALGAADPAREHEWLQALRSLPSAMDEVLGQREAIAAIAAAHAPRRRAWALVGNGQDRIAAEEIRIKLSELCYKSIPCDATEDKKHIDLSTEPMVLVCAAGARGSLAEDVAKEIAIFKAHKAVPIVIAARGGAGFPTAAATIEVPSVHPSLDFVLATVAGHLFGYGAAQAIDRLARPLREARAVLDGLAGAQDADEVARRLRAEIAPHAQRFVGELREGRYDGSIEPRTATRIATLLRYAQGLFPLDAYEADQGAIASPGRLADDLADALTRGIEELTRPIDAIKHQAKTVTVGISRADEALLTVPLVRGILAAGTPRERIPYRELRTLAALDPAVREVLGFTRYRIEGDLEGEGATLHVIDRGGVAATLPSRTAANPSLRGTKHTVASERRILVARGRSDGRTVVIVPEVRGERPVGIALLHVAFHERLPAATLRGVLDGYRSRYSALKDAVTETEPAFREELLGKMPVAELLTEPVNVLAERWRNGAR
ncbi:MAG: SIS domain-containing protein [Planctomycetes bacterium]|nr:SIS domain-containing protein [Planctomycetota bacterium]